MDLYEQLAKGLDLQKPGWRLDFAHQGDLYDLARGMSTQQDIDRRILDRGMTFIRAAIEVGIVTTATVPEVVKKAKPEYTIEQQVDKSWAVFHGGGFMKGDFDYKEEARRWLDRWQTEEARAVQ